MTKRHICHHGMAKARGCSHVAVGKFSKLFDLPGLAVTEEEAAIIGGPGGLMHDFDGNSPDCDVPAAYIFLAQFIDHDITLDTTTDLRGSPLAKADIEKLPNIRSASLDLDCIYGFGPGGSPHIYDPDRPGRIAENPNGHDLARSPDGVALIGDPRNDENIFVAQVQLLFHRLHNRIYVERAGQDFETAQRETRFHYQWIVLFDFLKRICDPDVWSFAAEKICDTREKFPLCYGLDAHGKLSMPVEFSVAAFRVGHTMVRSSYAVNDGHTDVELFDDAFSTLGFSESPEALAIDWSYMLDTDPHHRPIMSKAFDPFLADEIQNMPRAVVNSNNPADRALAFRNLLRGNALSLPSGQAVAAELNKKGYSMVSPCDIDADNIRGWERLEKHGKEKSRLRDNTPLFYYLLRESELKNGGKRFGPTGSALLMEVFGGILKLCGTSFVHDPDWIPDPCLFVEKKHWHKTDYEKDFVKARLIDDPGHYPFSLADVARYLRS